MRSLYVLVRHVLVRLFALLAASVWFAGSSWVHLGGGDFPPIPLWGCAGVLFSLGIGVGLMALMFYATATTKLGMVGAKLPTPLEFTPKLRKTSVKYPA
jgi:hypothetical protein